MIICLKGHCRHIVLEIPMRLKLPVVLLTPYLLVQVRSSGDVPVRQHTRNKNVIQ